MRSLCCSGKKVNVNSLYINHPSVLVTISLLNSKYFDISECCNLENIHLENVKEIDIRDLRGLKNSEGSSYMMDPTIRIENCHIRYYLENTIFYPNLKN